MVFFLLFCVIAMWQLTWPDHFSDFETFFTNDLFLNAAHTLFNLKIYSNMFWKAFDLSYLVTTRHAENLGFSADNFKFNMLNL